MDWVAVVQQLNRDLFAIEMAKSGLAHQQSAINSIPLIDPSTGVPVSKDEFKDLASAQFIIEQVGLEALIGLISNAIETFSIRLIATSMKSGNRLRSPVKTLRSQIELVNFGRSTMCSSTKKAMWRAPILGQLVFSLRMVISKMRRTLSICPPIR